MLSFQPQIIFFDIDDTLMISREQRIPSSTREALRCLKQRGIQTAIATGRTPAVLPTALRELMDECGVDLLVSINGQYIRYREHELLSFSMPLSDIAAIGSYLDNLGIAYGLVSERSIRVSRQTDELTAAMSALRIPYTPIRRIEDETVYQMLAFYPPEYSESIENTLPERERYKTVRWHEYGVDILSRDGSKARGIQAALNHLGLDIKRAIAFGDGLNDCEMLDAVGFGIAMGNAHPDLQARADYVCPPIAQDGIYRGLAELGILPISGSLKGK